MSIASLYRPRNQVDRKGFYDGRLGNHRFFDIGFDSAYDAAYLAGVRVRFRERPASFGDSRELKPGNGDLSGVSL